MVSVKKIAFSFCLSISLFIFLPPSLASCRYLSRVRPLFRIFERIRAQCGPSIKRIAVDHRPKRHRRSSAAIDPLERRALFTVPDKITGKSNVTQTREKKREFYHHQKLPSNWTILFTRTTALAPGVHKISQNIPSSNLPSFSNNTTVSSKISSKSLPDKMAHDVSMNTTANSTTRSSSLISSRNTDFRERRARN